MAKRTIVTARSVIDDQHIFIKCENTLEAFRTAQKLHKLGENRYYQIRLRATAPSLKSYRWISLLPTILNGA